MSMGFLEVFSFRHNCTDIVVAVYKVFVQFCQENPLGGKNLRFRSCEKGKKIPSKRPQKGGTTRGTIWGTMKTLIK